MTASISFQDFPDSSQTAGSALRQHRGRALITDAVQDKLRFERGNSNNEVTTVSLLRLRCVVTSSHRSLRIIHRRLPDLFLSSYREGRSRRARSSAKRLQRPTMSGAGVHGAKPVISTTGTESWRPLPGTVSVLRWPK